MRAAPLDLEVSFHVRRRSGAKLNRRDLRAVCTAAVEGEGIDGLALLTVTFVDDDEIQQINVQHRGINSPTDVLSFPLVDASVGFALPPDAPRELGDVIVSYPRAVAQAEEYGHSVQREVAYLVVHGVLHILGHDHEVPAEQATMRQREEAALAVAGLLRKP